MLIAIRRNRFHIRYISGAWSAPRFHWSVRVPYGTLTNDPYCGSRLWAGIYFRHYSVL